MSEKTVEKEVESGGAEEMLSDWVDRKMRYVKIIATSTGDVEVLDRVRQGKESHKEEGGERKEKGEEGAAEVEGVVLHLLLTTNENETPGNFIKAWEELADRLSALPSDVKKVCVSLPPKCREVEWIWEPVFTRCPLHIESLRVT